MSKKTDKPDRDAEKVSPENTNTPTEAPPANTPEADKIDIDFSQGLAGFLASNNISIGFTSYQTGRLYLVGHGADGTLALHEAV